MKTIKTIILLAVCSILTTSCLSDEDKALNYVKTQLLPEEKIDQYLIANTARERNSDFWHNFYDYLYANVNGTLNRLLPIEGYGHYDKWGDRVDYWLDYSENGKYDSDKILREMLNKVTGIINDVTGDLSMDYDGFELGEKDDKDWYNTIIVEAAKKNADYIYEKYNHFYYDDVYKFDWLEKNEEEQNKILFPLTAYLLSSARNEVLSQNYILVDSHAIKTSEGHFEVTYLLNPKRKIIFTISKVGETFCLDEVYTVD